MRPSTQTPHGGGVRHSTAIIAGGIHPVRVRSALQAPLASTGASERSHQPGIFKESRSEHKRIAPRGRTQPAHQVMTQWRQLHIHRSALGHELSCSRCAGHALLELNIDEGIPPRTRVLLITAASFHFRSASRLPNARLLIQPCAGRTFIIYSVLKAQPRLSHM